MLRYLRLLNPFVSLAGETDARDAARAGAVGAFLGAAQSAVGAVTLLVTADTFMAATKAAMKAQAATARAAPEAQAIAEAMVPGMLNMMIGMAVVFALVYAALGVVQWRKLTRFIPLLLLLIAIVALLSTLRANLMVSPELRAQYDSPLWVGILQRVANTAQLLLFIVGFRGATLLARLKTPSAGVAA